MKKNIENLRKIKKKNMSQDRPMDFFADALNTLEDPVITTDEYGMINFINKAAKEMILSTDENLTGLHLDKVMRLKTAVNSSTSLTGYLENINTSGLPEGVAVYIGFDKKGRKGAEVRVKILPVRNAENRLTGYIFKLKNASEKFLSDKEERYHILFDLSPSGILLEDKDGYIIDANPAVCQSLGYSRDELVGKKVQMLTHPDVVHLVEKNIARLLSGELLKHSEKSIRHDGTVCYMELHETKVPLPGGADGILSLAEDVTDRVIAERDLRHTRDQIQAVLDAVPGGVSWISSDLKYLGVNRYLWEGLNIRPDEIIGKEVGFMGKSPVFVRFVKEFFRSNAVQIAREVRTSIHDGYRDMLMVAQKYNQNQAAVLVGIDITRMKDADEKFRKEKRFNENIIQTAPELIITLDEQGTILEFNKYAADLTGYSRVDVLGKNWFDLFVPDEIREDLIKFYHQFYHGTTGLKMNENLIVCKSGLKKLISWQNSLMRDENGNTFAVLAVGLDISLRNQLEEQLRQSQKMEAIGQLAGGVAHDFNNMLTVILGYGELLLRRLSDDEYSSDNLRVIIESANRAQALTQQLLAFSRRQILQPKVVDLNNLISDMGKMLHRLIGEDVKLISNLEDELKPIKADPSQIEQIIMNLAVNARDAMPKGGELIIETANHCVDQNTRTTASDMDSGPYVMMRVTDSGIGMDSKVKEKIFEPFFSTKDKSKGTGLGLSTVYGIVRQSNGHIFVETEPGKGTSFSIYFPAESGTLVVEESPAIDENDLTGSETVLVVEDEDAVRTLVGETLRTYGYNVIEAADGTDGLAITREHQGDIDLILTDIVMPKMYGTEMARKIKTDRPGITVIYMSGHRDLDNHEDGNRMAENSNFIQKPFSPSELARFIKKILKVGE
ncbi:MAG: PAS domain S-box protein [Calditrichaceae bacterium]